MARAPRNPGAPPRPKRTEPPAYMIGATRFSDEPPPFFDAANVISRVKSIAPVRSILRKARIDRNHGPARHDGDWALAYLAFVISGEVNVQPWWRRAMSDLRLWKACGFASPPAYQTVWQRFCELEEVQEVFTEAAQHLIGLARTRDPRIGAWWSVDGTEAETHAQPQHACGPDDDCPWRQGMRSPSLPTVSVAEANRLRGAEMVDEDDDAAEIEETEEAEAAAAAEAEEEAGDEAAGGGGGRRRRRRRGGRGAGSGSAGGGGSAQRLQPIPERGREEDADGVRWAANGHWWRTRDRDAGMRSYRNKKYWFGMMNVKVIDVVTGAALAVQVIPANVNEAAVLPMVYDSGVRATGIDPVALIADKGYAQDSVYDFLVRRDCTPVMPHRQRGQGSPVAEAGERHDRHGIPLCPGCGVPGDFRRFSEKTTTPRVWYRCSMPSTKECTGEHSIAVTENIRRILPIWRTSPVYGALRGQVGVYERAHEEWRTHFRVGGKNLRERPRRIGIACQQLRSNAALLVQWVWVLARQGWLAGGAGNGAGPGNGDGPGGGRVKATVISAARYIAAITKARKREHLFGGGYPSRGGVAARGGRVRGGPLPAGP